MAHTPTEEVTAVDRLKAYGTLGLSAFLLLKLPLVLVGFGAAAGIGIAATQVEGGLPAVLGKVKDTFFDAVGVVGSDLKSLFSAVDSTLDESGAKPPVLPEKDAGTTFLDKTSKTAFDIEAANMNKHRYHPTPYQPSKETKKPA